MPKKTKCYSCGNVLETRVVKFSYPNSTEHHRLCKLCYLVYQTVSELYKKSLAGDEKATSKLQALGILKATTTETTACPTPKK